MTTLVRRLCILLAVSDPCEPCVFVGRLCLAPLFPPDTLLVVTIVGIQVFVLLTKDLHRGSGEGANLHADLWLKIVGTPVLLFRSSSTKFRIIVAGWSRSAMVLGNNNLSRPLIGSLSGPARGWSSRHCRGTAIGSHQRGNIYYKKRGIGASRV